ncbi:hypothetical protein [Tamaricihabitans halophyticus]|uniref:hypothetical protein n=1 Tax=Tamaricihabitans halophyticus TaxID=1262583 RepID=UPI00104A6EAD|nr:hypothetical protein [Tamaricihabitans halophyticus]
MAPDRVSSWRAKGRRGGALRSLNGRSLNGRAVNWRALNWGKIALAVGLLLTFVVLLLLGTQQPS